AARRSGQTGQTERNGHNARTARTGHKNTQKYDDAELPCALPLAFGSFGFLRGGMLLIPETLLVITKEASWVIGVDCGELARRLDSLDGAAVCA
ncbi:hypothetical protein R6H00_10840, partial [Actinotignum timonense]|nr:hypothetical protein [Actinotignum timonense]